MARVFYRIAGAAGVVCCASLAVAGEASDFQLKAWPPKQTVVRAGVALVHIDLVNDGAVSVRRCRDNMGPTRAEFDYRIHIHDADGRMPELTEYGDGFFHPERYEDSLFVDSVQCESFESYRIRPETVALNTLYVLEPGNTYTVSFTIKDHRLAAKERVSSNWVLVTVK